MRSSELPLGNLRVLRVHDERIDGKVGAELAHAIADLVERGHPRIVLDLGRVRFMDSTGLACLVGSLKLVGRQGQLSVAGLQEGLQILFKLTRMDRVFPNHVTIEDATRAPKPAGV